MVSSISLSDGTVSGVESLNHIPGNFEWGQEEIEMLEFGMGKIFQVT